MKSKRILVTGEPALSAPTFANASCEKDIP